MRKDRANQRSPTRRVLESVSTARVPNARPVNLLPDSLCTHLTPKLAKSVEHYVEAMFACKCLREQLITEQWIKNEETRSSELTSRLACVKQVPRGKDSSIFKCLSPRHWLKGEAVQPKRTAGVRSCRLEAVGRQRPDFFAFGNVRVDSRKETRLLVPLTAQKFFKSLA